jgi:lysophospholipid acyltransferase (LPLAT)-like uncharacterized protein
MREITLTKRGKIVAGVLAAIAGYLLVSAVLAAITPDECKVPTDQMNQGCIALIYK